MILQTGTHYHPSNYSIFVYNKRSILIRDEIFNVCFCTDIFYAGDILQTSLKNTLNVDKPSNLCICEDRF